jgi:hypothetical protein
MKWLDRLRARTATPTGDALTKLTKVPDAGAVGLPPGGALVGSARQDPSFETQGGAVPTGHVPATRAAATAAIRGNAGRGGTPFAALPHGSLRVFYQRFSVDYAVADGEYTPRQLRRTKMVVKPWGPVLAYRLRYPAADAGRLHPRPGSAPMHAVPTGHEHRRTEGRWPAKTDQRGRMATWTRGLQAGQDRRP